jgi:biotin transport system substrate-specific component
MSVISTSPYIADSLWSRSKVSTYIQISLLTMLTIVSAQVVIPLPFTPIPITLQTFAILFGAAALGPIKSTIAQTLYILLALIGFPVLASDKGGFEAVFGATAGYLFAFILSSYVVGILAKKFSTKLVINVFISYFAGTLLIYLLGASWLSFYTGNGIIYGIEKGVLPFIIGDILKAFLAASLLPITWRLIKK